MACLTKTQGGQIIVWLFSMGAAFTQSQSTICVWDGISDENEPTYANPNGEYILAGTTTDPDGGSHNYWEKQPSNCPQYLQALWWSTDRTNYWCIWNTLTPDWEATSHPLLECEDWPEISSPLLCSSEWIDWTGFTSTKSPITLQSGSCPVLTCPAIQVTKSGLAACNKLFERDATKKNVFTYSSGSRTTHLYFNSNTFKWYCSDTLDTEGCDDMTHARVSSKTDGWTDVSVGGEFTVTLSNDMNALFQCTTVPSLDPTTKPTANPSRLPTNNPTRKPTVHPTKTPTLSPILTKQPTQQPTKKPSKQPIPAPTKAPVQSPSSSPTRGPSRSPAKDPSNSGTEAAQSTTQELNRLLDDDEETLFTIEGLIVLAVLALIVVAILILSCICVSVVCPCKRDQKHERFKRPSVSGVKAMGNDEAQMDDARAGEHDEVYKWLKAEMCLEKYAALFRAQEYTSLERIMEIQSKDRLREIGVSKVGHQTLILSEIQKLIAMSSNAALANPAVQMMHSQAVGESIENQLHIQEVNEGDSDEECLGDITVGK